MGGAGKIKNVPLLYIAAFIAALMGQLLYWRQIQQIPAPLSGGIGVAPNAASASIISFGDKQFFYRAQGLALQTAGDRAGASTPLQSLDYGRLTGWFKLLSDMDSESQYAPVLAGYYYGASRDPEQIRQIIGYLQKLAIAHPQTQWRWLAHAVYLARHRLEDLPLALDLARQLAALPERNMPIWTRQLPAFVLADMGEIAAARDIMNAILAENPELPQEEQRFMQNYLAQRLGLPADRK